MGDICQSSYQPAHRRTCGPCIRTRWRPLRTHCTHHKPKPRGTRCRLAAQATCGWASLHPVCKPRRVRMQCACPLALSHQSASTPASSLIPNSRAASGQLWALTSIFSYICLDVTSVVQLHKASLRRSLPSILYTPLIPDVKVAIFLQALFLRLRDRAPCPCPCAGHLPGQSPCFRLGTPLSRK